jgi:serine-type D-Ala-D-Ala carboxypeptidase (penicillin-binding protein 5/6)
MSKKKSPPKNITQYYLISAALIVLSIVVLLATPIFLKNTQQNLIRTELEIPKNNSTIKLPEFIYPPTPKGMLPPVLSAKAVYVEDLNTKTILYEKNAHEKVPIASTTKIMTAIVGSNYFKPNSILEASQGAKIAGSTMGLTFGEKLTFRSLLYGMLLNSGNDAAFTIAENYPGGVSGFVDAMNKKAKDLGLGDTHFENPAGFDGPNHYSSAADLAIIAKESLQYSDLSKVFATKETEIFSLDKKEGHKLVNLNKLLTTVQGVLGIKTGYTDLAKENLVGLVSRDNHKVLTVVLGSDDRFGETTALIEWVYDNFTWQQ